MTGIIQVMATMHSRSATLWETAGRHSADQTRLAQTHRRGARMLATRGWGARVIGSRALTPTDWSGC